MNPGLKGRDIRDSFDTDECKILLVANKFQTGFDPLWEKALRKERRRRRRS